MEKLGQYPVISLPLKSAKQPNFEMAYEALQNEIRREFRRHEYICNSKGLNDDEIKYFQKIMHKTATPVCLWGGRRSVSGIL